MPISHRQGEYFALSHGEYSDYSFNGLYRVLRDIDLAAELDDYLNTRKTLALLRNTEIEEPDDEDAYEFRTSLNLSATGLAAHMVQKGVIEEIDYDEIHVGYDFIPSEIRTHAYTRAINLEARSNT